MQQIVNNNKTCRSVFSWQEPKCLYTVSILFFFLVPIALLSKCRMSDLRQLIDFNGGSRIAFSNYLNSFARIPKTEKGIEMLFWVLSTFLWKYFYSWSKFWTRMKKRKRFYFVKIVQIVCARMKQGAVIYHGLKFM